MYVQKSRENFSANDYASHHKNSKGKGNRSVASLLEQQLQFLEKQRDDFKSSSRMKTMVHFTIIPGNYLLTF